jgi:hypothetical protein
MESDDLSPGLPNLFEINLYLECGNIIIINPDTREMS